MKMKKYKTQASVMRSSNGTRALPFRLLLEHVAILDHVGCSTGRDRRAKWACYPVPPRSEE